MTDTKCGGSLLATTQELFNTRAKRLTLDIVAYDVGVTPQWLSLFGKGRIPEPGVNKVQRLYEYLSGRKLEF